MKIEQKERERIEADIDAYIKDLWHDVHSPNNNSPKIVEAITHFRAGKQSEHLHFQKEVIQPKDKRISELEAENKALREAATRYRDGELVERSTIIKSLFESGDPMRELSVGQFMDYIKEFTPPTNQTEKR